jgi:putative endonuclease
VDKDTIGRWGEHLAARWLRTKKRKVLYRNYRAPQGGEVDIVCRHGDTLNFVEVKTRTSTDFGRPGAAVTPAKEKLILRGARAWLRMLGDPDVKTRCDIVEVVLRDGERADIQIIEGALRIWDSKG